MGTGQFKVTAAIKRVTHASRFSCHVNNTVLGAWLALVGDGGTLSGGVVVVVNLLLRQRPHTSGKEHENRRHVDVGLHGSVSCVTLGQHLSKPQFFHLKSGHNNTYPGGP